MIYAWYRYILLAVLLGLPFSLKAMDDLIEEWPERVYLVHASHHMLRDSTAIAGHGSNINETTLLPQTRMTHHHCLGGLVPDQNMGRHVNFGGYKILEHDPEGHSDTPYVYMEPWTEFRQQMIGGLPCDTYIFGNHTYGPRSVVFIPKKELTAFHKKNLGFKGKIIKYDPETTRTRDLVRDHLRELRAWEFVHGSSQEDILIHRYDRESCPPVRLSQRQIQEGWEEMGYAYLNHNDSPFCYLEQVLEIGCVSYVRSLLEERNPYHDLMEPIQMQKLRKIVTLYLDAILEILEKGSPESLTLFDQWREKIQKILSFYTDLSLAKGQGKILKWGTSNERFLEGRKQLSAEDFQPLEDYIAVNRFLFPDFWAVFTGNPKEVERLVEIADVDPMSRKHILSFVALSSLYIPERREEALQLLQKANAISAEGLKVNKAVVYHTYDIYLFSFISFARSEKMPDTQETLSLFNDLRVRTFLAHYYEASDLFSQEMTLERFLSLHHESRHFYEASQLDEDKYGTFFDVPLSLRQKIWGYLNEQKPLQTLKDASVLYKEAQRLTGQLTTETLHAEAEIYSLMKAGCLGTLEEIFGELHLRDKFREAFPTDDQFWEEGNKLNSHMQRTMEAIKIDPASLPGYPFFLGKTFLMILNELRE